MKVVILAGGLGSRISEESHLKPKPMIEIGDLPILCHIMKIYSYYGYKEFIVCAGYKQHIIKQYFADYYLRHSDVTFDFSQDNNVIYHTSKTEDWKVTIIDTGLHTLTGGRLKRVARFIGDEPFMLTYGDAVSDVDISALVAHHEKTGKIATITAVQPGGRFGTLDIDKDLSVKRFAEKTKESGGWINAGFMVLNPQVFDCIEGDQTVLEREPLEKLSRMGELCAFKHDGFWQCMDTLKEKIYLENLWLNNKAPWKKWE